MKGNKLIDDHVQISVNLVKYKAHGKQFEIAVDPDKAVAYLEGDAIDIDEIIESDVIFADMKKGLAAGEADLVSVFDTRETESIVKVMLAKGEVQLSAKYRAELRERKLKRVIHLVHINAINPKTKLPHPENRVAAAIEEAKIRINDLQKAEDQVEDIVNKLRPIIPISLEKMKLTIFVPAQVAAKVYGKAKPYATQEQWLSDGSLKMELALPAGLQEQVTNELQQISQGEIDIQIEK